MRLDNFITEKFSLASRSKAANLIKKGAVFINGKTVTKAGAEVTDADDVKIIDEGYASLGAYKLEKAAAVFGLSFSDKVAADVGASNGGFTDFMIKNGAKTVYAVDVAECQLPIWLKNNPNVVVRDKINARYLTEEVLGEKVDFVTVDVSFISLKLVLLPIKSVLKEDGKIVALIKPQFEIGHRASKSGIVTSVSDRLKAVSEVVEFAKSIGLGLLDVCAVPRFFENKNVEYTALFENIVPGKKYLTDLTKEFLNNVE